MYNQHSIAQIQPHLPHRPRLRTAKEQSHRVRFELLLKTKGRLSVIKRAASPLPSSSASSPAVIEQQMRQKASPLCSPNPSDIAYMQNWALIACECVDVKDPWMLRQLAWGSCGEDLSPNLEREREAKSDFRERKMCIITSQSGGEEAELSR